MKKNYQNISTLIILFFCFSLANLCYASTTTPNKFHKPINGFFFNKINSKSPLQINGIVFPVTINPLTIPNLKVNQTADYTFSYLVSNTKNTPVLSYVWVDFDNNASYTADEAVVNSIPANATNFKVNINYPNANFIVKLKIGTLNIKFITTSTTLIDDALTTNIDERSINLGVDGETETFSQKTIAGIAISGSVFVDGNGITDGIISGIGVATINNLPVNAYLIDNTNLIIDKSIVTLGGSYKFDKLYKAKYIVAISLGSYPNGTTLASIIPNLPAGWNLAGESYGTRGNLPLGIEPGLPNMQIPIETQVSTFGTDIFGVNFALNRTPIASNDEISTPINTPVTDCNLTANDNDPDGNTTIDKINILLTDPKDGLKKTTVTLANKGEFKVSAAGEVSFLPVNNFLGVVPTITYTIKDKGGIESNNGVIKLVVKPVGVDDAQVLDTKVPSITINILNNDGISGILAIPAETISFPENVKDFVVNPNGDVTFIFPPNQLVPNTYVYTYRLRTVDGVLSDTIKATITVAFSPSITLVKKAEFNDTNNDGLAQAGETITYSFKVTNTGNVDVINITVSDPKINLLNAEVLPKILKPGETGLLNITPNIYTITDADILAGEVLNTATATGLEPITNKIINTSSNATVIFPILKIKLVKSSIIIDLNGDGIAHVGDKIEYTFTVTNTGTLAVTNISITDPKIGIVNALIKPSTLAPGAIGTLTSASTYTITQADIDRGFVSNKATANGVNTLNSPVSDESENGNLTTVTDPNCATCTITEIIKIPRIALVKTVKFRNVVGDNTAQAGDVLDYTFTVTNTGNVPITNVILTDAKLNLINVNLFPIVLLPGQTIVLTNASTVYVITQADIDAEEVINSASVKALDPNNVEVTDISGTTITNNEPTVYKFATIKIVKSSKVTDLNNNGTVDIGDRIEYSFVVTNTGNLVLTNIVVSDFGANLTGGPIASLAPNQSDSTTFKAFYIITQADVNIGFVYNQATAIGKSPANRDVIATSTSGNPTKPTDVISPSCPNCTITQVPRNPKIALVKTAQFVDSNNDGIAQVGEKILYTFTITNTGNVDISNLVINDAKLKLVNAVVTPLILGPNAETVLSNASTTYTITQADINAGQISNTAEAKGIYPNNGIVKDTSGTTKTNNTPTVFKFAILSLVKSSTVTDVNGNGFSDAGDRINYIFTIKNIGTSILTNITLADIGATITGGPIVSLAPNQTNNTAFSATYIITQDDVNKRFVYNTATATASSPGKTNDVTATSTNGNPTKPTDVINPTCPTCTITPVEQKGKIALVKKVVNVGTGVNGSFMVGDVIRYSFTITNVGNIALNNIVLTDPLFVVNNIPLLITTLLPQASTTAIGQYTINAADALIGQVVNQAIVKGLDPNNNVVEDKSGTGIAADDKTITPLAKPPIAVNDAVTPKQNTPIIIEVLKNDIAVSSPLVVTTVTIITSPLHGSVVINPNGTVTYTPNPGYVGSDLFTYTVKDANTLTSNTAVVIITVTATAPIAVDDSEKTEINKEIKLGIIANDIPDGSPLDVTTVQYTSPTNGKVIDNKDGTFTYTPNPNFAGVDEFTYTVKDGNGNTTNTATVKIKVEGIFIPNVFTPNGDGINDTFELVGKDNYVSVEIEIFNRWGNQVYKNLNYQNQWLADGLNEGTYYYIIKLKSLADSKIVKGWVLIKR